MDEGNPQPRYASHADRELGEHLLRCWRAARADPEAHGPALADARRAARRGPVLHPGEIVADRVLLRERLRDGALAASWSGWDLVDEVPVAVKVLHAQHIGDPPTVARFFEAAERMGAVSHPSIPRVRSSGCEYAGFPLFITEWHGEATLEQRVLGGLPRWSAVQAVLDAGHALVAAHAAGLFHRDVGPHHVHLDHRGRAWLAGFDLAPAGAAHLGSAYQAPESLQPGAEPTAPADVYSLAMTLLFALHGQALPFWVLRDPERLVAEIDAPQPVREALRAALDWDPSARTAAVEAFLDAVLASGEVLRGLARSVAGRGEPEEAVAAWRRALDVHRTRAEAREALEGILAAHEARSSWEAFVATAHELLPLLDGTRLAALQHRLGRVCLEHLGDRHGALAWLERARDNGFEHPDLGPALERTRAVCGDWPQVVRLLEQEARGQPASEAAHTLRRAARVARFASHGPESARRVYEALTSSTADAEASSWLAASALAEGDPVRALHHLEGLAEEPGPDAPRWLRDSATLAELLRDRGRVEEARRRIEVALARQPAHLASLRVLAALHTDAGELVEAEAVWERVLAVVCGGGVPEREYEARSELARLAWVRGHLQRAREHAEALTLLRPERADAWWAVGRVAMSGVRSASDDQPWLRATPPCFTPHEALARLLAGVVSPATLDAWLRVDPVGVALAEAFDGRSARELAAAAVDLMLRRRLVGPALFDRLADAFPEAGVGVEAVRWLWCEAPTDTPFPVAESYRWASEGPDLDPRVHRAILPLDAPLAEDLPAPPDHLRTLSAEPAWELLLRRDGDEPLAIEVSSADPSATAPVHAEPAPRIVLQLEGSHSVVVEQDRVVLGPELGFPVDAAAVELHRCGSRVYVVGQAQVDGSAVEEARLHGGERITVAGVAFRVHLGEAPEDLLEEIEPELEPDGDDLDLGDFIEGEDDPTSVASRTPHHEPPRIGSSAPSASPSVSASPPSIAELVLDDGTPTGRVIAVKGPVFTIGRGRKSDLQLTGDAKISRHHCTLICDDHGTLTLRDHDSSNGTWVNGRRISEQVLQVGDLFAVGDHLFEVRGGPVDEIELDEPLFEGHE